ncbi:MAG: OB-fold domain-containing protein [Pseudomonadota bacterium]
MADTSQRTGDYLGMELTLDPFDIENVPFFDYLSQGELRLQRNPENGLMRYPPTSRCPFSGKTDHEWTKVEPVGTVYSYTEVHHAIQPAFQAHTPYMVLMVELDVQRGQPGEHDGIRMMGNLVTPDGEMAPPDLVARTGIGSRMRMVFKPIGTGMAMPCWTLDETVDQPSPWRYPQE